MFLENIVLYGRETSLNPTIVFFFFIMENMNSLLIQLENDNVKIDNITFQKMLLLHNAVEEGWTIKKRKGAYVFFKNHEGKREILDEKYLMTFLKNNFDVKKVIV